MTNTITTTVIEDGPRNLVIEINIAGDGSGDMLIGFNGLHAGTAIGSLIAFQAATHFCRSASSSSSAIRLASAALM